MMPPEDELCLLLARARLSSEARERALTLLRGPLEWPRLFERAKVYETFPLLHVGLRALGYPGVPDSVRLEWTNVFNLNAIRNELLARESASILRLLGEAGIPAVPLKGVALAESLYGDAALRACADIDVLVPLQRGVEAFHAVVSYGYRAPFTEPRLVDLLVRYGKDCLILTRQDSMGAYALELHCGLVWGGPLERELLEEVWSDAARKEFCGVPAFALSAEWEFLYLAVHAARHGGPSLKWYVDLDRLCCRAAINWRKISERAKWLGWEAAVRSSLATCQSLFETPLDPALVLAPLPRRSGVPRPADVPAVYDILFLLRLLNTPGRRLRFLAIHLFVPTVADCEFLPLPTSLFFVYYALRPFRVTCNAAWWLIQSALAAVRMSRQQVAGPAP